MDRRRIQPTVRHGRRLTCRDAANTVGPMDGESLGQIALRRLLWVQDFAARLCDLGAPASTEALVALGKERFDSGPERDAVAAAESVWSEWPTES